MEPFTTHDSTTPDKGTLKDLSAHQLPAWVRAANVLVAISRPPGALRTDLAHDRTSPQRLYSAAEMIAHAADLISQAAGAELDSEPRWRSFRHHVQQVAGVPLD
jgi:hypothetical protein